MNKPIFDVHYADQRTALVMAADLDRGWVELKKPTGSSAKPGFRIGMI